MLHKICCISFILIFICLYLYVKIVSFANENNSSRPLSLQLTSEIARVLTVSVRRVTNVEYVGDHASGSLNVSFNILEPNPKEIDKNEADTKTVLISVDQLFTSGNFKVLINGSIVVLNKMPKPTINTIYFNNSGLKDVSKYSDSVYTSVPNDASLTNFYKLGFDSNFNITPKLQQVITISNQPLPTKPINFA